MTLYIIQVHLNLYEFRLLILIYDILFFNNNFEMLVTSISIRLPKHLEIQLLQGQVTHFWNPLAGLLHDQNQTPSKPFAY